MSKPTLDDALQGATAAQEIERLSAALDGAADYLDRLPKVPETLRMTKALREAAKPRPLASANPFFTRRHEFIKHLPAGQPIGIRLDAEPGRLQMVAIIPAAVGEKGKAAEVDIELDRKALDELIAYLGEVRRNAF